MWDKAIEIAAQYGPFPFGIVIGIFINQIAYHKTFAYVREEKKAYDEEKKELMKLIQTQQGRIDKLHETLYPKQARRKQS